MAQNEQLCQFYLLQYFYKSRAALIKFEKWLHVGLASKFFPSREANFIYDHDTTMRVKITTKISTPKITTGTLFVFT